MYICTMKDKKIIITYGGISLKQALIIAFAIVFIVFMLAIIYTLIFELCN